MKYESFIAVSRFQNGTLAEIRIHPVELRYDSDRLALRGILRIAPPDTARRILTRIQELSEPYGTTSRIDRNVGIIRP